MTGFQNRTPKSKNGVSRVSISDCKGIWRSNLERLSVRRRRWSVMQRWSSWTSIPAHLPLTSPTSHSLHFWLSGGTFYTWVTKKPFGSGLYAPWRGAYRSGIFVMVQSININQSIYISGYLQSYWSFCEFIWSSCNPRTVIGKPVFVTAPSSCCWIFLYDVLHSKKEYIYIMLR